MAQNVNNPSAESSEDLFVDSADLAASDSDTRVEPVAEEESLLQKERKLRDNLSRYLVAISLALCFYTFVLDHIQVLNKVFASASYVTTILTTLLTLGMVFLIFKSGYPLDEFGITLKRWQYSVKESILFTLPILLFILLVKWIAIKTVPAFHQVLLFNLHGAVVNDSYDDAVHAHVVWLQTLLLYTFLIAPFQELAARGGVPAALSMFLTTKHRSWIAILVTSLIFSTTHLAYPIHIAILSFVGGIFWGWLFHRQKNLIGVSISHAMIGLWVFWFLGIS